ncbi:MAG: putative phage tail protein, partial [Angelakisella sp.]
MLNDYLPPIYDKSDEVHALQSAIAPLTDRALNDFWSATDQLDVNLATWGLKAWEQALNLDVLASKPPEYRRTRILSKLRSIGTTTVDMIKNVASSFSNGEVEIIETPSEYRFAIKFTGTVGTPPNMKDMTAAIDEIKPAHLAYEYIIIFRTHGELKRYTNAEMKA